LLKNYTEMKARAGNYLAVLLLVFAFTDTAIAQSDSESCLKIYETPKAKIRAGFIPYKAQVVLGEPLQVTFSVENLGPTNFEFWFGGDYRGTGRHDRFKVAVTNANGEALPDPIAQPLDFGGFVQQVNLKPGQFFTNVVDLTDFRVVDKPGVYTVSCSFAFDEQWHTKEHTNPVVNSTFTLTILERTPERVAKVLDELVEKAKISRGQDLGDTLTLIAHFGKNDAVSRLAQLTENGSVELRSAALGAFSLIPTDASLDIVLAGLKDSDPAIRSAAASSLGAMQKSRGVDALLDALPKEKSPVAEAILLALGTSKSDRAFPVITNTLDAGEVELQRAAIDALVNFGGSNAVAALTQCITTNYLSLRYEIVSALAEKLHQPMQAEWLLPVLMEREFNTHQWLDSLRLLRMYAGGQAIPAMLSCLDFDVAWSGRNWWILNEVKACPNAPSIDYTYEADLGGKPGYPDGTPEMWTNNLRTLQKLKTLAGPIFVALPVRCPLVPYLKTDPPIDFTPTFKTVEEDGMEIKSGFLTATIHHLSENDDYSPSESYRSVYQLAAHLRALPNASNQQREKPNITPEQMKQLTDLLNVFAKKLCGSKVSDLWISNFYNLLVNDSDYCPASAACFGFAFTDYREAPPNLKEQAKAELMDEVRIFSQNYHAGTVEFVESAKRIFTPAQLEQILK
jgi:hypothetical protein